MATFNPKTSNVTLAVIGLGVGTMAIAWFLSRKREIRKRLKHPDPKAWQRIGKVKEINMYPVRSGAALQLEQAECDTFGLISNGFRDRRLLLVRDAHDVSDEGDSDDSDAKNEKVCFADAYPAMLSIRSELVAYAKVRLIAPNAAPIFVDLTAVRKVSTFTEKTMRGYRYQVLECQAAHHKWFSQVILQRDTGVRLYISLDPIVESPWLRSTKHDVAPIMVIHDKSVADLNARLSVENQAHHLQFRSNILIETDVLGVRAFEEDNWLWCRIGGDYSDSDNDNNRVSNETILRCIGPCLRCTMVNLNVDTYRRNEDDEPLTTLKQYRLRSNPKEPEMGLYFDVCKTGMVHRGDNVYVQYEDDY